jgi:hypothetical protein
VYGSAVVESKSTSFPRSIERSKKGDGYGQVEESGRI